MKILLLYFTGTYSTLYITTLIKNQLINKNHEVDVFSVFDKAKMNVKKYDYVCIGYPIYNYNAPKTVIDKLKKLNIENKNYLIYKVGGKNIRFNDASFKVGGFVVDPFRVCHDVCCVGFNIYNNSNKISIVTDLGHTTKEIVEKLFDSRLVVLEANHDEKMVMAGSYHPALKQRVLSNAGHLSNINSARVIAELAQRGVRQVLLAHLSEENNTPTLCYSTVCDYLESVGVVPNVNIKIDIAKPYGVGPIFRMD